jgi:hypothetical protein
MARGLAVLAGSLVLATSAQVAVPGVPVPTTMQSLAVLALGMAPTVVVHLRNDLPTIRFFDSMPGIGC